MLGLAGGFVKTLLVHGSIWDGEADRATPAEVLLEGQRIAAVGPPGSLPREDARIVDASGATIMPGMVEAHGHLPFPQNTTYMTQLEDTPVEELVLTMVHNARVMLDQGFTGVIGAG